MWVLKKAQNFDMWRRGRGFSRGAGQTQGQEDVLLGAQQLFQFGKRMGSLDWCAGVRAWRSRGRPGQVTDGHSGRDGQQSPSLSSAGHGNTGSLHFPAFSQ